MQVQAEATFYHQENNNEFSGEHVWSIKRTVTAPGVDVAEAMKERTDELAISQMNLTAERVWKQIREDFYPKEVLVVQRGLTREQVIRHVHRTRRRHFGADLHGVVEVPPLALVSGTNLPIFQFYRTIGRPALIKLLKYRKTTLFIDGTFRCVPRPFYQCVVVMVFDNATDLFVPGFFYTLCSAKTQDTYWYLMEVINVAADDKIQPSVVVCDFEAVL
ncbi:hypothetical protein P3T76_014117 [Phytophthora citrophthora]|uniref:MULE transposase domain-containing protein n=1 Tax=Phytophthora citrophthora TaxID=4793 RepID=A0AAD9G297_9STRA|nr:hypothetical protein P3T76_014117 [Phytophthora citrophthora]